MRIVQLFTYENYFLTPWVAKKVSKEIYFGILSLVYLRDVYAFNTSFFYSFHG